MVVGVGWPGSICIRALWRGGACGGDGCEAGLAGLLPCALRGRGAALGAVVVLPCGVHGGVALGVDGCGCGDGLPGGWGYCHLRGGRNWGTLYLVLCSFLPVCGQYSREANFCEGFKLVTELLLVISNVVLLVVVTFIGDSFL